jgi:hypothetical protein
MYQPVVHGSQAAPRNTKRAFLLTGTAYKGKAVCYNFDITDAIAEHSTGTIATLTAAISAWCDARRVQVEAPSYQNNLNFAGVVDEVSDGKVGPAWILIHEPGSICEIYAKSVATVGSRNTGQLMNFLMDYASTASVVGTAVGTANGEFYDGGFPGVGAAQLLAEGAAANYYMAELQTGPPSGGVQRYSIVSTSPGVTIITHGVVLISAAAAGTVVAALLSVAAGKFVGQHLQIRIAAAAGTATLEFQPRVSIADGVTALLSLENGTVANCWNQAATTWAFLTGATNDRVDAKWDGVQWYCVGTPPRTA